MSDGLTPHATRDSMGRFLVCRRSTISQKRSFTPLSGRLRPRPRRRNSSSRRPSSILRRWQLKERQVASGISRPATVRESVMVHPERAGTSMQATARPARDGGGRLHRPLERVFAPHWLFRPTAVPRGACSAGSSGPAAPRAARGIRVWIGLPRTPSPADPPPCCRRWPCRRLSQLQPVVDAAAHKLAEALFLHGKFNRRQADIAGRKCQLGILASGSRKVPS